MNTSTRPFPAAADTASPVSAERRKSAFKSIFLVARGNFREMCDCRVFG